MVTIARPGQNARYTFSGTAGQQVTVVLTGNALDDGSATTNNTTAVTVFKPTSPLVGGIATGSLATTTTATTIDVTLPETGTYGVVISPTGLDQGTINLQVKSTVTGALAVGDNIALSLSAGRNARFTFAAQAATAYRLAVTGLVFTPGGGTMQVFLRKADGTFITNCPLSAPASCVFNATSFPTAGTYVFDFDPQGLSAASFSAALNLNTAAASRRANPRQ